MNTSGLGVVHIYIFLIFFDFRLVPRLPLVHKFRGQLSGSNPLR